MSETFTVKFGKKTDPASTLQRSEDLIAVRTRSTRSLTAGPAPSASAAELAGGEVVLAFPEIGVEVYQVPIGIQDRSLDERKEALRMLPDVRFAGGVLVDEQSGEPVLYTENLFIKFVDTLDPEICRDVIRDAGLTIKQELEYATNAFFVAATEGIGTKVFGIALALLDRDDVEYCHPEIVRRRARRAIYPQQWHLKNTTVNGIAVNASANVEAAHQVTRGEGSVIAIIDDGVDVDHVEFSTPNKIVAPRDVTFGINDARPKDTGWPDDHGTACAGVACADGQSGASGVAPSARLMPIRLISGLGSQQEANAFKWAADNGADVISCSWGPPDGRWYDPDDPHHNIFVALPASTRLAIDYATTHGRNGKGCVVLFAAGNGNESVDNDGYASYERVITVAACNDRGKRSVYSDYGNAVWCAFPSNDVQHNAAGHPAPLTPGIWTTDRLGVAGYNNGNPQLGDKDGHFTNGFGGTSSACPGAAGVAALILAVNPDLKWHEVRDILAKSCDKIDVAGGGYDAQGRSKLYGFGRLNAETAVRLAQPQPRRSVSLNRTVYEPLPSLQTRAVSMIIGQTDVMETITVHVDIEHPRISDLVLILTPPSSAKVKAITLHDRECGTTKNLVRSYDLVNAPGLANLRGKNAKGAWKLTIESKGSQGEGTLRRFGIEYDLGAR